MLGVLNMANQQPTIKMQYIPSYYTKTNMPKRISFLTLLLLVLLLMETKCAISKQASQAINLAVAAAIKDGFRLIDAAMRSTYWYYLNGANQTDYKVKDLPDRLNYLITYTAPGSTFNVNCDLFKMTWKPSLNSFVRQAGGVSPNQPTPPITLSTEAALDLSKLSADINPPNPPSPPIVVITDLPKPSLTAGN